MADATARKRLEAAASPEDFVLSRGQVRKLKSARCSTVTCAQNNTPVHRAFADTLALYEKHHAAQRFVIPVRYKNPTTRRDPQEKGPDDPDYWWPEELYTDMVENDVRLHPKCRVIGDMRIQATAVNPLTGLDSHSRDASAIYGHPQLQMKVVPTPQGELPKILHTTGSISQRNYSHTKAGKRAEFLHTNGAVALHRRGRGFHLRHLNWSDSDGSFFDLGWRYTPEGRERVRAEALVLGDWHHLWTDPAFKRALRRLLVELRPKFLIWHDTLDGYAINSHHRNDPITRFVKHHRRLNDLEKEMRGAIADVLDFTPKGTQSIIVRSNHDEQVLRWLKECDPKDDPQNALLYHELMADMLRQALAGGAVNPFAWWAQKHFGSQLDGRVRFLERDEPFVVAGWLLNLHGDKGANGGRGSLVGFSRMGVKTMTGHVHAPGWFQGSGSVGTSTALSLEYTSGPSSWLNTVAAIYPNGRHQFINVIRGQF